MIGRILPALRVVPLAWISVSVAWAFTPYTTNQLVFLNVDHAPVGALSTFAYGYQGNICGFGTSSSSIPATSGGGVIIALSGTDGLKALPFVNSPSSISSSAAFFATNDVQRTLTPCTDQWNIPSAGLSFTHYTPAWSMSNIDTATLTDKKRFFLPATWMTFTITNNTSQSEDFYFGLPRAATEASFDNGAYEGFTMGEATMAVQSGSCDLLTGGNLSAALNGVSSGFAFHLSIAAGQTNSMTVVLAYYRGTIVDTRINASYYYTTLFSSVDNVIDSAFAEYPDAQIRCQQLATSMQNASLNPYRQFLANEALHSYQCNTACLIDSNKTLYWREVEGAYGNINTCDLMVDHAFYSAVMHPWALRNVLDAFSGASDSGNGYTFNHPLYNETNGAEASVNGFSFQHEMGGNTSEGLVSAAPSTDPTQYETVFSYMGQEELDNWILCAGMYWTHTGDHTWLTNNAALLTTCLNSMLLRDDTNGVTRDGVTTYVNYSPNSGKYEITSYDSLDPSLQDPRGGAYTAGKNWAAFLAMQAMFTQLGDSTNASTAANQAALCAHSVANGYNSTLGYIPASLVGTNTSATLPVLEGLSLAQWMGFTNATSMTGPYSGMLQALRKHASNVLVSGLCLDSTTGALKITSANANTFPSKVFIAQYAAENVLGLTGNAVDGIVDQVNATLQMQQSPYQGVSDQINTPGGSTLANSSLHYPRLITSALWWLTPSNNPAFPTPSTAPTSPTNLTALSGNGEAVLYWNASAQTTGYSIGRSTNSGGPYDVVANGISGSSFTDATVTNGVTYYYVVAANNQIGSSAISSQVRMTPSIIVNNSFSAQTVVRGSYLAGDPTDWSSSLLSGALDVVVSPGPDGSGEPWPIIPVPGLNGNNYCQIYAYQAEGGGTVYQDTGVKYQAGSTYTLSASFGLQTNQSFATGSSFGLYNSSLTPIASKTISTNTLTLGAFTNIAMNYTGTGNEGGNGDVIVGFNVPSTTGAAYFDFGNVNLAVINPPTITSQPISKVTGVGGATTFSIQSGGTPPLSYQWYFDSNIPVAGATNATLTLTNLRTSGTYDVMVTNAYGSVTSSIASLTVVTNTPISIGNFSFEAQRVTQGSYTNFGTGAPPNWSSTGVSGAVVAIVAPGAGDARGLGDNPAGLNGTNYAQIYAYQSGGTGMIYEDTGVKFVAGNNYILSAAFGLENGNFATGSTMALYNSSLTPVASKTITSSSLAFGAFSTIALNYTGTGGEGGNGDIIVGFAMPSTTTSSAFFDFDAVTLLAGIPVTAPSITNQPIGVTTNAGSSASFGVGVAGTAPLNYQWYNNSTPVSGATSASLTLTNVQAGGTYNVVVTNGYGSVTSSIVNLTVLMNAPTNLAATPGTALVSLSCAPVPNAAFYTIFRSRNSGGPYMKTAITSKPSYTDFNVIAGSTYYYVMSACNGYVLSPYSSQSSASPIGGSGRGSLIAPQASATISIPTNSPSISSTNTVIPLIVVARNSGLSEPISPALSKKIEQSVSTTPGKNYLLSVDVASNTGALVKGKLQFGESFHSIKTQSTSFTTLSWKVAVKTKSTKLTFTPEVTPSSKNQLLFRNLQAIPQ